MSLKSLVLLAIGVLVSTSALAFQEQKVGGEVPAATAAPQSPAPATAAPSTDAAQFSAEAIKQSEGTEVRIPGLGKLGVLPKMDFGLELLYGANDTGKQPEPETQTDDDLRVRGTIKHNF